jgi:type IV pilus assembly protein PilQ
MDFKDADINTVLRLLSLKSGVNIVAGPEVKGTVSIRLENVPWQQALEVVLRTYGYVYEKVENVIRVTTSEKMSAEELVTETFFLEYIQLGKKKTETATQQQVDSGTEVVDIVTTMLSERGRVKMVAQRNALVVTDTPTNIYKIKEVIKKLDRVTSQVFIDTKVVKSQLDKGENLGIKWNIANVGVSSGAARPNTFPFSTNTDTDEENVLPFAQRFFPRVAGSTSTSGTSTVSTATVNTSEPRAFPFPNPTISGQTFTFGTLDFTSFSALLSLLESRSNTKVVSNPRIVVLNNQTAKVKVGSEIPIPSFERNETTGSFEVTGFTYRDIGVVLNVTPHINSIEEILVDLKPEVSSLGATITYSATLAAPSFDVTNAETQVLIRSGETIAIGGLLENKLAVSETRVPYLGSLPVIGKLFRSKRQTEGSSNRNVETLFFVTVTLVDTEGQPTGERRKKDKDVLLSEETVGSQSVVNTTQPPLTPAKAGTA